MAGKSGAIKRGEPAAPGVRQGSRKTRGRAPIRRMGTKMRDSIA